MTDFHQTGIITTLHNLGKSSLERLEEELKEFVRLRPVALVLPALYSEFEGPAMPGIVKELAKVGYLKEVVLILDAATEKDFQRVREFMSPVANVKVIHNDGKRIKDIYAAFARNHLEVGQRGKGRSVWLASGYVLARGLSDVIVLHDCDIVTYSREMLARLCYPVVNPNLNFVFCKGFYSRVTDRMHGRVTRLLVTPLLRSLDSLFPGEFPFLKFLDSFRYLLSGEFAMVTDLARVNRIPWDWGLEVGSLAEVYRNFSPLRVCQVDIATTYEHKHQALSAGDPGKGLMRMTVDICKAIFRTMASEGAVFSDGLFKSLSVAYLRRAEDTIMKYEADAAINGLFFDRNGEAEAVDAFTKAIAIAARVYMEDPLATPLIPNWNRVTSAIPGILDMLTRAVEEDNR